MPRPGPAFLHNPLPPLSAFKWLPLWHWFIEGLAIVFPPAIQETGWQGIMRLDRKPSAGATGQTLLIERSRFGIQRLNHIEPSDSDLPIAVELPSSAVFETSINLPVVAIRNIDEAVRNRIEILSPLPAEDVVYAISEPKPLADGRFESSIAIVRKTAIEAVFCSPDKDRIALIGANADQNGRFSYTFADRPPTRQDYRKIMPILALCGGAISFFFGAIHQIDKRTDAENAYRDLLNQTIRAERLESAFLNYVPTALEIGLNGQEVDALLARLERATPPNSWIENIELTSTGVTAKGFAFSDADWPQRTALTLDATQRPNIQAFSLFIEAKGTP